MIANLRLIDIRERAGIHAIAFFVLCVRTSVVGGVRHERVAEELGEEFVWDGLGRDGERGRLGFLLSADEFFFELFGGGDGVLELFSQSFDCVLSFDVLILLTRT